MTNEELAANIKSLKAMLQDQLSTSNPEQAKVAAFSLLGLNIVGELLLDIKRIANAAERMAP